MVETNIAITAILISSIALFLLVLSWYIFPHLITHCGICQRLVRKTKSVRLYCPAGKFHFHKTCYYTMKYYYNQWFGNETYGYETYEDGKGRFWLLPTSTKAKERE